MDHEVETHEKPDRISVGCWMSVPAWYCTMKNLIEKVFPVRFGVALEMASVDFPQIFGPIDHLNAHKIVATREKMANDCFWVIDPCFHAIVHFSWVQTEFTFSYVIGEFFERESLVGIT